MTASGQKRQRIAKTLDMPGYLVDPVGAVLVPLADAFIVVTAT
jgi:hypothetical protein